MLKVSTFISFIAGVINCLLVSIIGWILFFVASLFISDRKLFRHIDGDLFISFVMFSVIICSIYAILVVFFFKPFGTNIKVKAIVTGLIGVLPIFFWKYAVSGESTVSGSQEFSFLSVIFLMGFLLPYLQRPLFELIRNWFITDKNNGIT